MPAREGKYGAISTELKKLHDGEPVFLLRSTDSIAPTAIEVYALLCRLRGCSQAHINACLAHADRIKLWQAANPMFVKEIPD